jgi:hypothetical protein
VDRSKSGTAAPEQGRITRAMAVAEPFGPGAATERLSPVGFSSLANRARCEQLASNGLHVEVSAELLASNQLRVHGSEQECSAPAAVEGLDRGARLGPHRLQGRGLGGWGGGGPGRCHALAPRIGEATPNGHDSLRRRTISAAARAR